MSTEFNRPQGAEHSPSEDSSSAERPPQGSSHTAEHSPQSDNGAAEPSPQGASAPAQGSSSTSASGGPRSLFKQSLVVGAVAGVLGLILGAYSWSQATSASKASSAVPMPLPNAIQVPRDSVSTGGELARATDQMRLQRSEEVVTSLASEKLAQEVAALRAELGSYKLANDAKMQQMETRLGVFRQQSLTDPAPRAAALKAAREAAQSPSRPKGAEAPAAPTLEQIRSALREEVRTAVKEELRNLPAPIINVQVPKPDPVPAAPGFRPEPEPELQGFSLEEDGRTSFAPPAANSPAPKAPPAPPAQPLRKTSAILGLVSPGVIAAVLPEDEAVDAPIEAHTIQYSYGGVTPGHPQGQSSGPSLYGPEPKLRPVPAEPNGGTPSVSAPPSGAPQPLGTPGGPQGPQARENAQLTLATPRPRQLIPRFSIARARLLIGAIAPASGSGNQPLPVTGLISGPWMTPGNLHIDLKGNCNFGGVAVGNDPTSRILVTVTRISCVAPDGRLWEAPGQAGAAGTSQPSAIGYMAGRYDLSGKHFDTYLGLDAKKVSNEGPLLLLRFLTATAGDYAKAAAQAQVTSNSTPGALGGATTTQNITGDKDAYIIGNSLASRAFPDLSSFITQLLAEARPYFYVEGGREAYVVLTENIDITDVLHQYLPDGMTGDAVMSAGMTSSARLP